MKNNIMFLLVAILASGVTTSSARANNKDQKCKHIPQNIKNIALKFESNDKKTIKLLYDSVDFIRTTLSEIQDSIDSSRSAVESAKSVLTEQEHKDVTTLFNALDEEIKWIQNYLNDLEKSSSQKAKNASRKKIAFHLRKFGCMHEPSYQQITNLVEKARQREEAQREKIRADWLRSLAVLKIILSS